MLSFVLGAKTTGRYTRSITLTSSSNNRSKYGPPSQIEADLLEEIAKLPCTTVDFVKLINLDYMMAIAMRYFEQERVARRLEWEQTSSLTRMQAFIRKSLASRR